MKHEVLLKSVERGVARLTLNRPDRRNALTRELITTLTRTLQALDGDSTARVIVLTGSGTAFCAGMDLEEVQAHGNEADARQDAADLTALFVQMQRQRQPIIAALNGPAVAGGAGVMTACDIVIASEAAKIGYPEVLRGLIASIVAPLLVRQVGERRARRLLLTGEIITADQAERMGLINEVAPAGQLNPRVDTIVAALLKAGPDAVAGTKRRLADAALDDAALAEAAEGSALARLGDEAREGLTAFLEKRFPRWRPADRT